MANELNGIEPTKAGGGFFFLSLLSLILLSMIVIPFVPALVDTGSISRLFKFSSGLIIGLLVGKYILPRRISVFIHELKHSIISNFAGNKAKGMKVTKNSGYFQYEYTKKSAKFNAFIALAPYFLPLFTIFTLGISLVPQFSAFHGLAIALVGVGYGTDLSLNFRDVSPYQTDFSMIHGGYRVGLVYVLCINFVIALLLLIWVLKGFVGWLHIVMQLWSLIKVSVLGAE